MHHALNRGFDEYKLYVRDVIIGKQVRFTKLRYKAKGRSSKAKHDIC